MYINESGYVHITFEQQHAQNHARWRGLAYFSLNAGGTLFTCSQLCGALERLKRLYVRGKSVRHWQRVGVGGLSAQGSRAMSDKRQQACRGDAEITALERSSLTSNVV